MESLDRIVAQEEQREREAKARAETQQQPSDGDGEQAVPTPTVVAQQSPTTKQEQSSSIVPYILMGVGGAMVISGVVVGAMAAGKHSELEDKCGGIGSCDPQYESLADEGKTLNITADVLMFGGLAAAATGGVLWFLDSSSDSSGEEQPVRAAVACGPHACNGRVAVSF
jgi:hypothetical protein